MSKGLFEIKGGNFVDFLRMESIKFVCKRALQLKNHGIDFWYRSRLIKIANVTQDRVSYGL